MSQLHYLCDIIYGVERLLAGDRVGTRPSTGLIQEEECLVAALGPVLGVAAVPAAVLQQP